MQHASGPYDRVYTARYWWKRASVTARHLAKRHTDSHEHVRARLDGHEWMDTDVKTGMNRRIGLEATD